MVTRKAAPALAAGCTMVLKPAEQTPLSALAVAQLGLEAGLPAGVLGIVTGGAEDAPEIGRTMTSSPLVRKLGFTGSTEVGKLLMAQCAGQVKKVSLELGGNAPFIVFDDADLDEAVAGALLCKYRNSGQTCISANRILVQAPVYDEFVQRLAAQASALNVGSGLEPDTRIGPLIEQQAIDKVERHVADAQERGAELLTGGEPLGGLFYQPTVIAGVPADAAMATEETFGPVGRHRPVHERGGGDPPGQRHALRPGCVLLQPRSGPRVARLRGARVRDRRHQHGCDLDRSGALRRRQGVGHRPRGLEVRDRGVARDQVPLPGRHRLVIVEQRDYHVFTGKLNEVVRMYETEGIELQQRHLGNLIGVFTTDIGALSTYTSMWGYESYAEREERRASLQADERWRDFLGRLQPLLHTQQNRILIPTSFSPIR